MRPCAYREAVEKASPVAPRPWKLVLRYKEGRVLYGMEVVAADGQIVEHRSTESYPAGDFARHVANARFYVAAVNGGGGELTLR